MFSFFKKKKETKKESIEEVINEDDKRKILKEIEYLENNTSDKNELYYEKVGLLYNQVQEYDKAIEKLEKSFEIKPSVGEGYKKLMSLYNKKRAEAARNGDDIGIETYMNKLDELRQIARKYTIGK